MLIQYSIIIINCHLFIVQLLLLNCIAHSEQQLLSKINIENVTSPNNDIYVSEFEITEMINHDGRLSNGFCCNGQRPAPGLGCKGGNTTCLPFWRVCIAELAPDMITVMGKEGIVLGNSSILSNIGQSTSFNLLTTTKRPSMIQNFFSKLFGNNSRDKNKYIKEIIDHISPSTCYVGFWSSKVLTSDTQFPIRFRKLVTFRHSKNTQTISNRNFISIVEIWSKNNRNDVKNRLISRQINYYNVFADTDHLSNEWYYGGKVFPPAPGIVNTVALSRNNPNEPTRTKEFLNKNLVNLNNRFTYRYRWHLKLLSKMREDGYTMEELNQLNLTSEGCSQGYRGADCNVPVCLEGCHPDHGYCDQPDQCTCRFGWTGLFCDYCLTLPGCVHGTCQRPLECRCEEGWTGMFCSIPKCKSNCHPSNGYCTKPGECKCKFGWQGENCTECSPLPGCQHGTCNEPLDCNCEQGWQGTFCSSPVCANGCENGWCDMPGKCRCKLGFRGENCTECVPYPDCLHGTCHENRPWTCKCDSGYGGFTCNEPLNWCQENSNPCLNGGTCISVEKEKGNYFCKCLIGYSGKNCEQISF